MSAKTKTRRQIERRKQRESAKLARATEHARRILEGRNLKAQGADAKLTAWQRLVKRGCADEQRRQAHV